MSLYERVAAWIADDVDEADVAELRALLDADDDSALAQRFAGPLRFGTAGLRGPLRAGPAGMNTTVVRRAAAGLAAWLNANDFAGRPVVVGYDGRHRSADFARDSAAIFAAAGFQAFLLEGPTPTPVTAFAVRHLGAAAGVMVTASHNPAQDNGYKVYGADGAQIVPPVDAQIEAAIHAVDATHDIPLGQYSVRDDILDAYLHAVSGLIEPGPRELSIVHTAMHGVGSPAVLRLLAHAGFTDVHSVAEQRDPDPDFPTVAFPNPEEPGALDLAIGSARARGAQLVIANDPDADRCAVAVPDAGRSATEVPDAGRSATEVPDAGRSATEVPDADGAWRMLRGDELGVLLADRLLSQHRAGTFATTIVSSSMLAALAAEAEVPYAETLTGFKWIMRAADDLAFGYEEALGYAVAPDIVRDKDGISAALVIAQYAAQLHAAGSSLPGRLAELAERFGHYVTDQISVRVEQLDEIAAMMTRLRQQPPARLLNQDAVVTDLRPDTDALRFQTDSARVVVRPSGTEPKLKVYLQVVAATRAEADTGIVALRAELSAALGR